jgi:hypothetical protein
MVRTTLLTMLALLIPGALTPMRALADSDGYYCANERYIAYEFHFSKYPHPRHVLTIVHLDDRPGPIAAQEVDLESFQVHGMKCDDAAVRLLAFTDLYTVDVSNRQGPLTITRTALNGDINTDPGVDMSAYREGRGNLGDWHGGGGSASENQSADPERPLFVTPLSPPGRTYRYDLRIAATETSEVVEGGVIYRFTIRSEIVKQSGAMIEGIWEVYDGDGEYAIH